MAVGPLLLHLADLHLGFQHSAYLGDKAAVRTAETNALLERIVEWVLQPGRQPDVVVLAGDLFDTPHPDEALVGQVLGALRRLNEAKVLTITLPGNHDELSYPDCVYNRHRSEWPGILVTSPQPIHLTTLVHNGGNYHFYGMSYIAGLSPRKVESFPVKLEGRHIGLLHATLDPSQEWGDRSLPLQSAQVAEWGLSYLALGHIHKARQKRCGKTLALYPGSIEGRGFADSGVRGLTYVDLGNNGVSVQTVPFRTREIVTQQLSLGRYDDLTQLRADIAAMASKELILRVELVGVGGWQPKIAQLQAELAHDFYHLEIVDKSSLLTSGHVQALAREETIRGCFVREMLDRLRRTPPERERERKILELALRRGLSAFDT